jgi:tetratricopeptide (TPR) repeat protein
MISARPTLVSLAIVALLRAASADPLQDAERLYRDGQNAFDLGHYSDALAAWQQSYELSHAPALVYNIAQAYRLRAHLGDCALARAQYQRFVELTGPSPQRSLADGYIAQLEPCASSPAGEPLAVSDGGSTHEHSLRNREIATTALAAGGVVLLATGAYLGHHASTLGDEVTSACAHGCSWSMVEGKNAAGRLDATLGWTFDALGVVALAGSAAFYWFGIHDNEIQVTPIATRSHESGAALSWETTW